MHKNTEKNKIVNESHEIQYKYVPIRILFERKTECVRAPDNEQQQHQIKSTFWIGHWYGLRVIGMAKGLIVDDDDDDGLSTGITILLLLLLFAFCLFFS